MKTSKILKITITALVTLGLSSSPAMAADPYTEPAPSATTESKTNKKTKAKDSVESLLKSSRSSISKKNWAQAKKDLIKSLTRLANAARQAEITQEISEIVGGADALASASSGSE